MSSEEDEQNKPLLSPTPQPPKPQPPRMKKLTRPKQEIITDTPIACLDSDSDDNDFPDPDWFALI